MRYYRLDTFAQERTYRLFFPCPIERRQMDEREAPLQGSPLTIFSIGHSNQPLEAFISLLQQHKVQVLVDVRSSPYSKYVSHFNGTQLASAVRQVSIKYLSMGKELGGRPDGDEFYDVESH